MKLTINKLIANDIINYGMNNTESFNSTISLNDYLEEFEDNDKQYILDNLGDIYMDIETSEVVADVTIVENEKGKNFDMTYYWGYTLNDTEKQILEESQKQKMALEYEEIKDIAEDLSLDSSITIQEKLEEYKKSNEKEMF